MNEKPRAWRDWREMREGIVRSLEARTGEGVEAWNRRIEERGFETEADLRSWLAAEGVTGYPQNLLVMERFGYPDYLLASAEKLLEGQYADREHLRAVLEAVLAVASELGEVAIQVRKTFVSLVSPRRQFAIIRATTKARLDLGLRIDGVEPAGRLKSAKGLGNETINLRIALSSPQEVDDEVLAWLRRAYEANA